MNILSKTTLPAWAVLILAGLTAGAWSVPAPPARLVLATIAIDGQVVLRASTSDDGDPDADAVWAYLTDELEFEETAEFASLEIEADVETLSFGWLKSRENEALGEPPSIELDVAYGGHDRPFRLELLRSPSGKTWRVDPAVVERRFPHRLISRSQAAALEEPRRTK